jgi:hypothetical protein
MSTYTKAKLVEMNSDKTYGFNWILNLQNINNNQLAKLFPTGNANFQAGKLYVALPANTVITKELIAKYNIWL